MSPSLPARPDAARRIFVIDDDQFTLKWMKRMLAVGGYEVEAFSNGPEALASLSAAAPDVVLCDLQMPGMDGFSILGAVRERAPSVKTIMVTSTTDLGFALKAMRLGAFDYVTKPVDPELLLESIGRAIEMKDLEEENRRYLAELARRDERMRSELLLARTIIGDLLPGAPPRVPGLEFGLRYEPSGEIGGDYYDFVLFREPNRLGLVLADISGHGVPAALLMTMFKMRANEAFRSLTHPAECLSVLNRALARDFPADSFVSAFYVVVDTSRPELTYAKASNEPALLLRPGREPQFLDRGTGSALAAFDPEVFGEAAYTQHTIPLEPGDTLLMYTDGLIEAVDASNRMLRLEGLVQWLKEEGDLAPQALADRLIERARAYAQDSELPDDITILAARYDPR